MAETVMSPSNLDNGGQKESKQKKEMSSSKSGMWNKWRDLSPKQLFDQKWLSNPVTGCWEWQLSTTGPMKYGRCSVRGLDPIAHRAAYELYRGPIPNGMCVCHKCDNPLCVNPVHLFIGSHSENLADMRRKGRYRNGYAPKTKHKLTMEQVKEIRFSSDRSKELAAKYDVSPQTITRIWQGVIWQHVT